MGYELSIEAWEERAERKRENLRELRRRREEAWGRFFSVLCTGIDVKRVRTKMLEWEHLDAEVAKMEFAMGIRTSEPKLDRIRRH